MRNTIHATAVALTALLAGGALTAEAADMSMAPLYQSESGPMAEYGSGWYLRGDVGYLNMGIPVGVAPSNVSNTAAPGSSQSLFGGNSLHFSDIGAGGGVGYQFNKWFRMDTTLDWRQQHDVNVTSYGQVCPIDSTHTVTTTSTTTTTAPDANGVMQTTTVTTTTTTPNVAYLNTANVGCYKNDTQSLQSWTGLLNFYGDLGSWFGLTPYVGGGVGFSHLKASAGELWYWNTGTPYGGAGVNSYLDTVSGNLVHLGYPGNVGPTQIRTNLSWALMAGVSYDIAPHVKLDLGYRYLNLGYLSGLNSAGQTVHKTIDTQEVRAGLRFTPDL